ncbi:hypothetical protein [uncultured Arthrobacter sp.]|uniref:hypothetical protein n=1 Tax=uncultured Arthrobacter sp. TaxID=114050 RepID=UPI00262552F6|nr:hypothetical protein [uncultured Arthrobacter sp.]
MSNGHESAQSRRSLRHARATSAGDQVSSEGRSESEAAPPFGHGASVQSGRPAAVSLEPAPRERRSRRAADVPVDAPSSSAAPSTERASQVRARDREMLRSYRALADQQAERPSSVPTRRQLRLQQQAAQEKRLQAEGISPAGQTGHQEAANQSEMTVEQALATREAIINQAQNQVAAMEAVAKDDPFSVDLELLAQQKALAERAAVLNTRAQKIQQLTQENKQRKPLLNDPTTAHNLSIVSPVEFIRMPMEKPDAPAPTTSHIPVVTAPAVSSRPPSSAISPDSTGRSHVLAQAEAMVREQRRPGSDGATPIRARSAYGLEPLDAMTAGLARVQRMRIVQYSVVGLGALALITGIMMIVGGF